MKKTNNKGFSLVELIIVIAIMAVLIGVLAPQFIKYVEQSRRSADVQMVDGLMNAMQVTSIDPSMGNGVATMTATITSAGITYGATVKTGVSNPTVADITAALAEVIPVNSTFKSTDWGTSIVITGTVQPNGSLTYTSVHTGGTVFFTDHAPTMKITCSR